MTGHRPPWSEVVRHAARADDLDALARAVVDHATTLGAHAPAVWTQVGTSGTWRRAAGDADAPDTPPLDDTTWTVELLAGDRRTTALGLRPGLDPADVATLAAVLEAGVLRLEAMASSDAVTQTGSQRLATVLDASPDAVLVVDASGTVVDANARAADLFGHALGDLVGSDVDRLVPDDVRDRHAALRAGYGDSPTQRAMAAGQDLRARHRDGTEFPVDIALAPIEADGRRAFAAFVRDATARHEAELHRRQLRDSELARDQALELNDNVVQGLVAAVWLMELGDVDEALHASRRTLASARRMMRDLMDDDRASITPGRLQRASPVPASGLHPDRPEAIVAGAPLRLLVADDSEDIRLLMDVRLRLVEDVEVVAFARDGLEAVAAVDAHAPDVVLMDLSMPKLDGLEATARIRKRHPTVRVVVLTGHPRATVEAEAVAAGADAVVEKGAAFETLLDVVRGAVVA